MTSTEPVCRYCGKGIGECLCRPRPDKGCGVETCAGCPDCKGLVWKGPGD